MSKLTPEQHEELLIIKQQFFTEEKLSKYYAIVLKAAEAGDKFAYEYLNNEGVLRTVKTKKNEYIMFFERFDKRRNSVIASHWRETVLERDNYTCQQCGKQGGILQVHHKILWSENQEKRFDIDNGETLCLDCHAAKHPEHKNFIKNGYFTGGKRK